MKTTIDTSEQDVADAMKFTKALTKREAVVTALQEFNRQQRMKALLRHAGNCDDLFSAAELQRLRRKG